jgi:hypothetical protein
LILVDIRNSEVLLSAPPSVPIAGGGFAVVLFLLAEFSLVPARFVVIFVV